MAEQAATVTTIADLAKRLDPNNRIARIVELLSQTNEMLADMMWKEGNLPTGERTTVRTGLPTVVWRLLNQGVAKSKSTTAQITEATGILEARSEVDKELADLSNNTSEFRLSEATAFIEAMNIEAQATYLYGNSSTAPEEFTGFAPRYADLSAANAQNILDAGGTGSDNSSVWLVIWGANTVFGVYPKGSQIGLQHEDLGLDDALDSSNNRFRAYMDRFVWKCGLALKDWRFVVRIANIDISNLVAKSSAADLQELMIKAIHRIPSLSMGRAAFYMNRSCLQMLDIQRRDTTTSGGGITFENVDGRQTLSFRGIPIRKVDSILETEARVT